jgi:3-hydroxyisobutyrate dehydrogenase
MEIGYVGLGAMGGALASRLLLSHKMRVWDMRPDAVAEFERKGAIGVSGGVDLARESDVIMLCLPRSSDVRRALLEPGGLRDGLAPGKIVIDQTSGDPKETQQMARQLAEKGITLIDAPVSGGASGAAAGTIAIMVSGSRETFDAVLPIFHSISPNVHYVEGGTGAAQAMKLVNNTMSAGCRLATLEVAAMGKKMGLSLGTITQVLNKGIGRNRTSEITLPEIVQHKPSSANIFMALMLKDLNLSMALAKSLGSPTLTTNVVSELLQIGVNTYGETAKLGRVIDLVESMAGTRIADELASI